MRALAASELLEIWERGQTLSPIERSLMLLAQAEGVAPAAVAEWPVGQRDARLLDLREWAFGSQLAALIPCPGCGETLELNFCTDDLRVQQAETTTRLAFAVADYQVECRPLNSADLLSLMALRDQTATRQHLMQRSLLKLTKAQDEVEAGALPMEVAQAIAAALEQADPQANLQLMLACPHCHQQSQCAFDIVTFFGEEIQTWARHILREVHLLASAYGWTETEILKLSPWRRQFYLHCIGT